jgi:ABC-type Na+ efflux pump permease subunit
MNFILVITLLVLAFIVIFLYAKLDEKIKKISGKGFVEDIKKEIEGLIVEFNKISNRKILVIDEKIKEMEKLIKLADDRIVKLDNMTRNYNEAIKRYELLKGEIERIKSEPPQVDTLNGKKQFGNEVRRTTRALNSNKKKVKTPDSDLNKSLPEMTVFDEISNQETKLEDDSKSTNIEGYNVDAMDLSERARLLEKLISEGVSDDELIGVGFTQSEIDMAKAVLKVK